MPGAQTEHDRKQIRDGDSDRARHLAVVDAGADHGAEPRPLQQEIQHDRGGDGASHQHQPIGRKYETENPGRGLQVARRRHRNGIAAPQQQAGVGNDEGHAERHQHLPERIGLQPGQHQPLEQTADRRNRDAGAERGHPDVQAVERAQRRGAEIGAEHEEGAVRQVGQPHQAEDQREARGQQEQQTTERQAVETLDDPKLHRLPISSGKLRASLPRNGSRIIAPGSLPADSRANRPGSSGMRSCHRSRTG